MEQVGVQIHREVRHKEESYVMRHQTTLADFFIEYEKDIDELAIHLFRADWQHKAMKMCIESA